ncbi:winged helix-turn-helix transcriptional regulator [Curtobacterium flaccumfaciens pv. flaccumfaciens]|uniref:winged helix-turn-helix transcriptional regulator n=1 Tax=Curtobacterium flaccumfaciens TaxID=2035 RepID=UPI001BD13E9D|nr:helix-turn-helix domain-containing protein [Curtobacterium flaccumfaciens]QVG65583.1 helix-turn-helix transcriptional regulator [Curtobacterium flaccumfaciens pv. flaccumfaciens]
MSMQISADLADDGAWRHESCPLNQAAAVVGSRASLLILREAFYGTARFTDFVARTGLTDAIVSGRLKILHAHGVFERRIYQEPKRRARFEYVLTAAGEELLPVVVALLQWGGAHLQHGAGPVALRSTSLGGAITTPVRAARGANVASDDLLVVAR